MLLLVLYKLILLARNISELCIKMTLSTQNANILLKHVSCVVYVFTLKEDVTRECFTLLYLFPFVIFCMKSEGMYCGKQLVNTWLFTGVSHRSDEKFSTKGPSETTSLRITTVDAYHNGAKWHCSWMHALGWMHARGWMCALGWLNACIRSNAHIRLNACIRLNSHLWLMLC